jgi:hypothetical protein
MNEEIMNEEIKNKTDTPAVEVYANMSTYMVQDLLDSLSYGGKFDFKKIEKHYLKHFKAIYKIGFKDGVKSQKEKGKK